MKRIVFITSVLLLVFSQAHAKELSLDGCIAIALDNNTGLKAFRMMSMASAEDAGISYTKLLPTLRLRGSYTLLDKADKLLFLETNALGSGIPPENTQLTAGNSKLYGVSLSIEQPVYTGGELTHSLFKSRIVYEETRHDVARQKQVLIFQVKKTFLETLKEQLFKGIIEKMLEAKKERLRVFGELYNEGHAQKEDVLQLENDLSSSEVELFKANNRLEFKMSMLRMLLNYQDSEGIVLQGKPVNGYLVATLQEATETAVKERDDLKMSDARARAANEDISIARSGFYPKASIEGRYTMQKDTNVTRPEQWAFLAQLDWPLFEWNRTSSEVRKAEALRQRQLYEYEETKKTVMTDAEEAWRSVKDREKEVGLNDRKLKTAEYGLKESAERYHEGAMKTADILEKEAGLIKAYNEYLASINDLNISLAKFESSVSSLREGWFVRTETYNPDIKAISQNISGPISGRTIADTLNQTTDVLTDAKRITDLQNISQPGSFEIQLGAFKTIQGAEEFRRSIISRVSGNKIVLLNEEGLHKVRVTGFKDREEAEKMMRTLDIKGFIVNADMRP